MVCRKVFISLIMCVYIWTTSAQNFNIINNGISFSFKLDGQSLQLTVTQGETVKLKGEIGIGLTKPLTACGDIDNCFKSGDAKLHVMADIENGITLFWESTNINIKLEDCFELGSYNWYGGPERWEQHWPIEKLILDDFANVPQEKEFGAITEPYWLNSAGAYIFVDERVPLFVNQNTGSYDKKVCFSAKIATPYPDRTKIILKYTIAAADNARQAHLHAVKHFLGKPSGHPNIKMIERPIWSTWVKYKRDVNDTTVLKFAQEIVDNGYSDGQFEIDDDWEDCYGALTFRESKFGDINNTVKKLKEMNFRVTLWIHPFVNLNCEKYRDIGRNYGYFVKNVEGSDLTQWWNTNNRAEALYLDFTKPEVQTWFVTRLRALQENHGIDSFKFDAGETSWAPPVSVLQGDIDTLPNKLVVDYVKACASFGDLVEVRTGWRTQYLPVFVRMIDKDSRWGVHNGLYTLITTLLQMNLNGYTWVLPDMVGGNAYVETPTAELFVRWLQANTFMPSIQFSYVPWDYDDPNIDVKTISKNLVDLHQKYAGYIKKQMQNTMDKGYPLNAPIWWVDPTDTKALKEDTEFLLGEDLLVAPVIVEGKLSRSVYLPIGTWVDGNDGTVYVGPKQIDDYVAPIEVLPYFFREGSDADLRNSASLMAVNLAIIVCVLFRLISDLV